MTYKKYPSPRDTLISATHSAFEKSRDQAALAVNSTKGNLQPMQNRGGSIAPDNSEVLTKRDLRRLSSGHKSDFCPNEIYGLMSIDNNI